MGSRSTSLPLFAGSKASLTPHRLVNLFHPHLIWFFQHLLTGMCIKLILFDLKFNSIFFSCLTLMTAKSSKMHLRPKLEAAMMSSCRQELPAATALAVAMVRGLVKRMRSSAVAFLGMSSVASNAWETLTELRAYKQKSGILSSVNMMSPDLPKSSCVANLGKQLCHVPVSTALSCTCISNVEILVHMKTEGWHQSY